HRWTCEAVRSTVHATYESRDSLRRQRHATPRGNGVSPEADAADRRTPDPLAHHEDVCALRLQGIHPLPGLQRRDDQRVLPELSLEYLRHDALSRPQSGSKVPYATHRGGLAGD